MAPVAVKPALAVTRPATAGAVTGRDSGPGAKFSEVLRQERIAAPPSPGSGDSTASAATVLGRLEAGRRRLDQIISQARAGRTFTAGELLTLQAEVYRISEEFSLAVKATEQVASGLKRLWHLQV